jgi:hypothetical protein
VTCHRFVTLTCSKCGHVDFAGSAEAAARPCPECGAVERQRTGGGFVCTRAAPRVRCSACGDLVADHILCDWRLAGAKAGKTCDRKCCRRCARHVGEDKDLCPAHAALWDKHPRNPQRT